MVSNPFSLSRVAAVLLLAVFIFAKPSEIFAKAEERQLVVETVDFMGTKVFRTSYGKHMDASMEGLTAVDPNSKDFKSRDQILTGQWRDILVTPSRVYVRNEWGEPYQYIPIERTKRGWSAGKPVPTPYVNILPAQMNPRNLFKPKKAVWLGEHPRKADNTETVAIFGDDGRPTITLDRITHNGLPTYVAMLSENTLASWFLDEAGNTVFGVMDREGRFLGPPMPRVRAFTPMFSYHQPPYQHFAVALDDEGKRFLPLTLEGTLPIETQPVKSYRRVNFFGVGPGVDPHGERIQAWLKEYDENGVSYWGWCSPDLTRQTGPIWRSIEQREIHRKNYFLAQLRDGSWMTYEPNDETLRNGVYFLMPHPMREKPEPDQATVLADVGARFIDRQRELMKDPIFNQQVTSTASHSTYATDLAKYSPHLKGKAELLETAIYRQDWIEGERLARELGGDYWVRYIVARRWNNGPIGAAYWYQLMTQTQDEKLRAQVEQIYAGKAAGDARYFAEQARQRQAAIDQQRANEYEDRRAAKAWMLAGGGLKMPSQNQPTSAERTATVNRYFSELDKYQRGQQTWEPPVPTVLGK